MEFFCSYSVVLTCTDTGIKNSPIIGTNLNKTIGTNTEFFNFAARSFIFNKDCFFISLFCLSIDS